VQGGKLEDGLNHIRANARHRLLYLEPGRPALVTLRAVGVFAKTLQLQAGRHHGSILGAADRIMADLTLDRVSDVCILV
jgi:hypothetical protein